MLDDNWFGDIKEDLAAAGFRSWVEGQEYMLPAGDMYEKAGFSYRGKQHWYAENTGWTDFLLYEKSLIS